MPSNPRRYHAFISYRGADAALAAVWVRQYLTSYRTEGQGEPTGGAVGADQGPIQFATFSPDGRYLAAVAPDRTVSLCGLAPQAQCVLLRHTGNVTEAHFSPDSRTLLATTSAGANPERGTLWSVAGDPLLEFTVDSETQLYRTGFSADGKLAFAAAGSGQVFIFATEARAALWRASPACPDAARLGPVAFDLAACAQHAEQTRSCLDKAHGFVERLACGE